MRKIAICHNEPVFLEQLSGQVRDIVSASRLEYEISCYQNSRMFLRICQEEQFHIVIFDMDMPGISGFEIARRMHRKSPKAVVIFLTGRAILEYEAFWYQPFWFLRTAEVEELLAPVLIRADQKRNLLEKTWQIELSGQTTEVEIARIRYIELRQDEIHVHTEGNGVFCYPDQLSRVEGQLKDSGFVRIDRTCIVNIRWVRHVLQSELVLHGEIPVRLPVKKAMALEIRQRLHEYLRLRLLG